MDFQIVDNVDFQSDNSRGSEERLRLGEILIKYELIDETDVPKILENQRETGLRFGEAVLKMGLLTEDQVNWALAYHLNIPYVELNMDMIDLQLVKSFPVKMLKQYDLIPIVQYDNEISVAMADPTNTQAISDIQSITDRDVKVSVALRKSIHDLLDEISSSGSEAVELGIITTEEYEPSSAANSVKPRESMMDTSGLAFIHFHLIQALNRQAKEIHIEPEEKELRIRYRIFGVLQDVRREAKSIHYAVTNRLKIMGSLPVSQVMPHKCLLKFKIGDQNINVQASIVPGVWGEVIVLQILQPIVPASINEYEFDTDELTFIQKQLLYLSGLGIVTGPVREARTQLLYSLLESVKSTHKRIISIENPIRKKLNFATQIDLVEAEGFTAKDVMQIIDAQAPDVISLNQMDMDSGELISPAIQNALSGRFIFGGLEYNNPFDALEYLMQHAPSPVPLAAKLRFILTQNVFPKLCPSCKEAYEPSKVILDELKIQKTDAVKFYKPVGCKQCKHSGYESEIQLFELFSANDEIKELLFSRADKSAIRECAAKTARVSLRDKAIQKVLTGELSVEDVLIRIN